MSRRIALPGADELFRQTSDPRTEQAAPPAQPASPSGPPPGATERALSVAPAPAEAPSEGSLGAPGEAEALDEAAGAVRGGVRRKARAVTERRPSGRERHEEKITVYVSNDELMDLEHARLGLRGDFGLSVDRGRVVREALAVVLADFEAKGENSILVRRLRGR